MTTRKRIDVWRVLRFLEENFKSREWLASELGVSLHTVIRFLRGKPPRRTTLEALARVMSIPPQALFLPDPTPSEQERAS